MVAIVQALYTHGGGGGGVGHGLRACDINCILNIAMVGYCYHFIIGRSGL